MTTADHDLPRPASGHPADPAEAAPPSSPEDEVTLLELLDRVLDKGVVLTGDITLSVADVDLVYVGLRVLLSSVESAQRARQNPAAGAPDLQGRGR
jgi:hypothetical protein